MRIVLDPGIDFAKQAADNLRILRELELFREFERPILLPVSRKSVIAHVLGISSPGERDARHGRLHRCGHASRGFNFSRS